MHNSKYKVGFFRPFFIKYPIMACAVIVVGTFIVVVGLADIDTYDMVIRGNLYIFHVRLYVEDKLTDAFYRFFGSFFYIIFFPSVFGVFSKVEGKTETATYIARLARQCASFLCLEPIIADSLVDYFLQKNFVAELIDEDCKFFGVFYTCISADNLDVMTACGHNVFYIGPIVYVVISVLFLGIEIFIQIDKYVLLILAQIIFYVFGLPCVIDMSVEIFDNFSQ